MGHHVWRIVRWQLVVLRRSPSRLASHLLGLVCLMGLSFARIDEAEQLAPALTLTLLFVAASGAPLTIGAHALVAERFGGTLEPLLLLPVSRSALIAGKMLGILAVALVELVAVWALSLAVAVLQGPAALRMALLSPELLLVLTVAAPELALLLTILVIVVSGRARDPQNAASLSLVAAAPLAGGVLLLWFAGYALGWTVLVAASAILAVVCAVAFRMSVVLLTDDALVSKRS